MSEVHIPVLMSQIIEMLKASLQGPNKLYFDGTFGRGGHLKAMLENFPEVKSIAFDRDADAISFGKQNFSNEISEGRLKLIRASFSDFEKFDLPKFDGMLLDLGVSSPQLDQGPRGFSFIHDGPLDMRMDHREEVTAKDLIHNLSEDELNELFKTLGEIPKPYRVVRAIVNDRKTKSFDTTRELASLIERVEGWRKKGFHPATLYFMALRLKVNRELEIIQESLLPLIHGLKPGGRLAVLTFHSLEDRIVKNVFKTQEVLGRPVNKKVIIAEWDEQKKNPRARSAKLRIFERHHEGSGSA